MDESIDFYIADAHRAASFAQEVRAYHRRRSPRGGKQREADLKEATRVVRAAMKPLRSYLCKAPYRPQNTTTAAEIERVREASARLQRERRKIWKMAQR